MDRSHESLSDDVFRALADRRRRIVLASLLEAEAPPAPADLAEKIVSREGPPAGDAGDAIDRVRIELYHKQLPHLIDAGLVRETRDGERLEATARADEIEPLLTPPATSFRTDRTDE